MFIPQGSFNLVKGLLNNDINIVNYSCQMIIILLTGYVMFLSEKKISALNCRYIFS